MLPWQAPVLEDCVSPILAVPAGIGSGKTRILVEKAIHVGYVNAPIPSMVVEPTYGMVTDNLLPMFEQVFSERDIEYRWVGPQGGGRKSSTITVFPGGSVPPYDILLRSADNPSRLDGKNLGFVGIDEAGQCKPGTIGRARRRVGRTLDAPVRQFMITGTPEKMNEYYDWCEGHPQPGTRLIRADTNENIYLPPDYVETTLSHLDEEERQQYMRGFFVPKGGRAYRGFNRAINGGSVRGLRGQRFEVGADFNVGKMSWTAAVVRGDEAHVFGELVRFDTTTDEQGIALTKYLQERVRREEGEMPTIESIRHRTTIYCDPAAKSRSTRAEKSDVEQLRAMGFRVECNHSTIPVKDRVMTVNGRFRLPKLFVDVAETPYLTKALEQQPRNADGEPVKSKNPKEDMSAETDALGYFVWGHSDWRATVPQGNRVSISTWAPA